MRGHDTEELATHDTEELATHDTEELATHATEELATHDIEENGSMSFRPSDPDQVADLIRDPRAEIQ